MKHVFIITNGVGINYEIHATRNSALDAAAKIPGRKYVQKHAVKGTGGTKRKYLVIGFENENMKPYREIIIATSTKQAISKAPKNLLVAAVILKGRIVA